MFRFDHVALNVRDLARSVAFYQALGAKRVSLPSPNFVELMLGELRMHLTQGQGAPPAMNQVSITHVCLRVERMQTLLEVRDLLNAHPSLVGLGPFEVQESPPLDAQRSGHVEEHVPRCTLYFQDPDGLHLELRCYP